jgi:hypothetical protein
LSTSVYKLAGEPTDRGSLRHDKPRLPARRAEERGAGPGPGPASDGRVVSDNLAVRRSSGGDIELGIAPVPATTAISAAGSAVVGQRVRVKVKVTVGPGESVSGLSCPTSSFSASAWSRPELALMPLRRTRGQCQEPGDREYRGRERRPRHAPVLTARTIFRHHCHPRLLPALSADATLRRLDLRR